MAHKPNVQNRWWVETTVKKPKQAQADKNLPQLPVAMGFYSVARDYDQDRAKDDLTDNNLRIIREANPPQGGWVYVPMTEERYRENLIKRIKDEFRLPREARGIVLDHGRIESEGTHAELVQKSEIYRGLYQHQFRSAVEEDETAG
jgi:hypothetical protein